MKKFLIIALSSLALSAVAFAEDATTTAADHHDEAATAEHHDEAAATDHNAKKPVAHKAKTAKKPTEKAAH